MKLKLRLVVLFILVSFISTTLFVPQATATGESWLMGWDYRKELTIFEVAGAEEDYPLDLTVFYGSGADTTEEVYLSAKCQTDFDDIRFTDDDGNTELDYLMETYTDSANATFWVKVNDSLIAGEVTIFIYYGNDAVSTTSDGDGVFLFFDDFENNNLNKWDTAEANWDTGPWRVKYGTYAAFGDADDAGRALNKEFSPSLTGDFMIHVWVQTELDTGTEFPMYGEDDENDEVYFAASRIDDFSTYNGVAWVTYDEASAIDDTWYRLEVAVDNTNSLFRLFINRVAATDTRPNLDGAGNTISGISDIGSITSTVEGTDSWMDDYYVRTWQLSEPYISGSLGEESIDWKLINDAEVIIHVGWDPVFQFGYDTFFIFLGLIMIPVSTMYLVRGGRKKMSMDKLFFFLIIFVVGFGLLVGGIMP